MVAICPNDDVVAVDFLVGAIRQLESSSQHTSHNNQDHRAPSGSYRPHPSLPSITSVT